MASPTLFQTIFTTHIIETSALIFYIFIITMLYLQNMEQIGIFTLFGYVLFANAFLLYLAYNTTEIAKQPLLFTLFIPIILLFISSIFVVQTVSNLHSKTTEITYTIVQRTLLDSWKILFLIGQLLVFLAFGVVYYYYNIPQTYFQSILFSPIVKGGVYMMLVGFGIIEVYLSFSLYLTARVKID